jgi:prolyl-tRNA editing enzyme YbaK/EbsC (Cys-tRNA(Pro) deacylase)
MGIEEVNRIKQFFSDTGIEVEYLEHKPVNTSAEAAAQRGFALKQGIKALLFTDGNVKFVVVDIPADLKVDIKKVAVFLDWPKNKIRMASSQEVLEETGCEIGAVPPFGHKKKITILFDSKIFENEVSAFNIGLRTVSVKIATKNMKIVFSRLNAKEGDFTL